MAETLEKHEEDAAWLKQHFPFRVAAIEGAFCERVAIKVAEGIPETAARFQALQELREREK